MHTGHALCVVCCTRRAAVVSAPLCSMPGMRLQTLNALVGLWCRSGSFVGGLLYSCCASQWLPPPLQCCLCTHAGKCQAAGCEDAWCHTGTSAVNSALDSSNWFLLTALHSSCWASDSRAGGLFVALAGLQCAALAASAAGPATTLDVQLFCLLSRDPACHI
jgi:hypothetical protein